MTNFVLVHGAWHGGWCWKYVAERLRAAGHTVFTPTLTGLGERAHLLAPTINLQTHVRDVVGLLQWEDLSDVVLCGHSYGGMVIAGASDREAARLKAVVYLDAFVPRDGDSAVSQMDPARLAERRELVRAQGAGWRLPPVPAAVFVDTEAERAWVDGKCTDHPFACFTQPLRLSGAYLQVPRKIYIRAGGYPVPHFDAAVERLSGAPDWLVKTLACGHDVMVDMPDELTTELIAAGA